ncbi:hypothetical protein [Actinoplanes sp. HUAS TT8]|uniref:hypothetical protein n=1 Tax=Actinoplanes sp. HUAS TT8 TaxID=3447453 RepID=UPI003F523E0C
MTGNPAADEFFAALDKLRRATGSISYATLVRQAAAQRPPLQISSQRLSDWFGGRAVPADPAVVRFLVGCLQQRTARDPGYRPHPLSWWLAVHERALRQRQLSREPGGRQPPRAADERSDPTVAGRLGEPIGDSDPLALEVHPAIQIPGTEPGAVLPDYVIRSHDVDLRKIADALLDNGRSRLITLVGGSSTGKTRAGWELACYLEVQQPGRWRIWHPYDPTRLDAALAELDRVGPYTIVWLNEAQHYLMPTDTARGERIAAALRTLLRDPDRTPVLVLATLWPDYWTTLTTRPGGDSPDVYAQARELLSGTAVTLTETFTAAEMAALTGPTTDVRLRYAARHAENGRITQYLAGAPVLEAQYRTAPPAARAVLRVAMDARRLGHPLALSRALLEQAAPGYLDNDEWDSLGEDWLDRALTYTAVSSAGARGALTRIRARPGEEITPAGQPLYRLADYLEQLGVIERHGVYPPDSLWRAVASVATESGTLMTFGRQAEGRGRYQHAAMFYRLVADRGDTIGMRELARRLDAAGDSAGAEAMAIRAADQGDVLVLRELAALREQTGDVAGAAALYRQAAQRGDIVALRDLKALRQEAPGMLGTPRSSDSLWFYQMAELQNLDRLRDLAARQELTRLNTRADDDGAMLLGAMNASPQAAEIWGRVGRQVRDGDFAGAEALCRQAADLGNSSALWVLARIREGAGDSAGADRIRRFGLTGSGEIATSLDLSD